MWNGNERREFVRRKFPCKILITTPEEKMILSHTQDICEVGVNVLLEERLEVDTRVYVEI
jgi:hypothetical protein